MNRTIVEKARCLLYDSDLSKEFWAEAVNTAVYLQNRTVSTCLNYKTPFELWTNAKPDISHLRVFGSRVMKHVPKEKRQKWDKKSEECILVGYAEDVKGYRIYNPNTKLIMTSRDVIIIEKDSNFSKVTVDCQNSEALPVGKEKCQDSVGDSQSDESFISIDNACDSSYVPNEDENSDSSTGSHNSVVKSLPARERHQPDRYGFSNFCTESSNEEIGELPIEEALEGPEREHWIKAVHEELQCFHDNDAWTLTDVPEGKTIVKCKWVLKKKCDSENNITFRARLVAKGYNQKSGIDYTETFSPVVRHTTLRLLFALAVQLDLETAHLDVKTAFLNGELDKTIYIYAIAKML